jgi:hypothetical protein
VTRVGCHFDAEVWNGIQRDHHGQRKKVKRNMHACVFDSMDIVHKDWVPAEQIINITAQKFLKD